MRKFVVALGLVTLAGCAPAPPTLISSAGYSVPRTGPVVGCVNVSNVRNPTVPIRDAVIIRVGDTCPPGMVETPEAEYFNHAFEAERARRIAGPAFPVANRVEVPAAYTVTQSGSEFDRYIAFIGSRTTLPGPTTEDGASFYLLSMVPRGGGAALHQVAYSDQYIQRSWRFYDRATDDQARTLSVSGPEREVVSCARSSGCLFQESMGAIVSEATLRDGARRGGYRVRFSGRGYHQVVEVQPAAIDAQLAAIFEYRRRQR